MHRSNVVLAFIAATLAFEAVPPRAFAQSLPRVGQDTAAARRALEQRLGRRVTQAAILDRLRDSGMTRDEARARLRQAGLDPALADQYFDVLDKGGEPPSGQPSNAFIDALARIGLAGGSTSLRADSLDRFRTSDPFDDVARDSLAPGEEEIFGLSTFRRAGRIFQPVENGPVDPRYRLGPGDEILLVLTGDVEQAYPPLEVSREGVLFIPDIGQITVNGITLAQLEDELYGRLRRVYSGVSRSANATTRFHVSIGRLGTNRIVITGDVARPGSYQLSSVAGLFTALYQAGDPRAQGSFRRGASRRRCVSGCRSLRLPDPRRRFERHPARAQRPDLRSALEHCTASMPASPQCESRSGPWPAWTIASCTPLMSVRCRCRRQHGLRLFARCVAPRARPARRSAGVREPSQDRRSVPRLLYYALENRPAWFRSIWRAADGTRRAISRAPTRVKHVAADAIACGVYYPLARLSRRLEQWNIDVGHVPLSFYRNCSIYTMRTDALDRFGTRIEHRFTRADVARLMTAAGLADLRFSEHAPFWCAVGHRVD